jgi:hypothetical protein
MKISKVLHMFLISSLGIASILVSGYPQSGDTAARDWTISDVANPEQPGRQVDVRHDGTMVARFIYGEGQIKPYLHVFGVAGEQLTKGDPRGRFPHHRGIFIGWNHLHSDLGRFDLWHLNQGGRMTVAKIDRMDVTAEGATLVATVEWRGNATDSDPGELILTEQRTLTITRPRPDQTQIDASFQLHAARDLRLEGDLQHAGVHFRASQEVSEREGETYYLTAPESTVAGDNLQWCRFLFPVGQTWYSVQQMNAPGNPVEELSMRAYGRFGYFFKRTMARDETLTINYRFVVQPSEAPGQAPHLTPSQAKAARQQSTQLYTEFSGK